MTREEEAIKLAKKFVEDLAKVLYDYKDEFVEDIDSEDVTV